MSSLDCPIVSVNVRIWRFWSFFYKHDAMRYLGIIPITVMNVFMLFDLCRSWNNYDNMIINAYFVVLWFDAVLRGLVLIFNRGKFEHFLERIAVEYKKIETTDDYFIRWTVSNFTRQARMLSFGNLCLGGIICTCFAVYPLFAGGRKLLYGVYIPTINEFDSPQYEILYVIQVLLLFPGSCMYIPFPSFFSSITLFGLIQIKTLQYQLTTLGDTSKGKDARNLNLIVNNLIEDHLHIINYVQDVNLLFSNICLAEFLMSGILMSALLFFLSICENRAQIVIIMVYILMIITQSFVFYWQANEVREESMGIAKAAYSAPWIEMDVSVKKKLLLIVLRAQRPLEIKLGNVYPMTLELFQSLMNASYSYFTLLKRVQN
ncbi:odorant receptor Or2-like [Sabethes cyaneus]|uniref:odorant receptor Or2-like n=1 Tax=Sabethes cyaneus TaxID=53552 RepID=UPI00237E318B|nr:odorant receptor Or2-like [Sabethes cyaneus]